MSNYKLFNDPIYGLISYKFKILYDIIEHPYFQRLRRISQMGLSSLVYPGATHTRFQHALGALFLMTKAVESLRTKGVLITEEEEQAVSIAILCHDLGHGPFSHALEYKLLPYHHEEITMALLQNLELEFGEPIKMAICIFKGQYPKKFLTQLVSSQLDVDRMDYLSRDSFFTGVAEGIIGYDRILKMIDVHDDELVVEEKGLYSIEKFLTARYVMYHQVYFHKTSFIAEKMMSSLVERIKWLLQNGDDDKVEVSNQIKALLKRKQSDFFEGLSQFVILDDVDIIHIIKSNVDSNDKILKLLANSLIKRQLFSINLQQFSNEELKSQLAEKCLEYFSVKKEDLSYLIYSGTEKIITYNSDVETIKIKTKSDEILNFTSQLFGINNQVSEIFNYIIFPRNILT